MGFALALYAAFVAALTVAEYRGDKRAQYLLKPACALGFILIALMSGALESLYGQIILAGLCFCAVGDVALLSRKNQKLFRAGMMFFGLGHVLFTLAFLQYGLNPYVRLYGKNIMAMAVGSGIICITGACIILPHIKSPIQTLARVYSAIITLMAVIATLTASPIIMNGALAFAVSDYFVGRDRFIAQKPWHALAITPLYFGAQALFALSVAQAL